ncbi:hypothetical protein SAMN04515667_1318 [Formosa sp. Hel1_31_208]|nr:hypothetical protein SAMN04515667_1318 [Formosa sp. Hel1_31_208]
MLIAILGFAVFYALRGSHQYKLKSKTLLLNLSES